MRPDTKTGLDDLIRASELIQSALTNVTLEQFLNNWEKQSAVERQFMIIGEVLVRIRKNEPTVFASIPDSRAIIGFRDVLAHGYDVAVPEDIYELAGPKLTNLRENVTRLVSSS